MQEISKIEQPTSPPLSISPKFSSDMKNKLTQMLERGKQSAHLMKTLFDHDQRPGLQVEDHKDQGDADDDHHHHKALDHHSSVILNSFVESLSLLRSCDFDDQRDENEIIITKGDQVDRTVDVDSPDHYKADQASSGDTSKDRRGCYKRRKTGQSWVLETTNLIDDGRAWRKYGQKAILNAKYPRNYYRCTHKHDQECYATKQVQQISENPTKFKITYNGHHTCKNLLKNPPSIIINSPDENSSVLMSFEPKNYNNPTPKHALNPFIFPSSAFPATPDHHHHHHHHQMASAPHDHHHGAHNQYSSSSSDNSPDHPTATGPSSTPVSDQGDAISTAEFYSSTATTHDMDDVYRFINNMNQYDSVFLDQVLLQDVGSWSP